METNLGPLGPVPVFCRIVRSNALSLSGNLSNLKVASSQYDILFSSETFVTDMRHVSQLLVPGIGRTVVLGRSRMPRSRGMPA